MIDFLTSGPAILALTVLTLVCIMIGMDNIRFIDIATEKLDKNTNTKAVNLSVLMAFILRLLPLVIVYWALSLTAPFWDINLSWFRAELTGEALLLIVGGLFLLFKGTSEIHEEVEDRGFDIRKLKTEQSSSFGKSIWQTTVINVVFSFDAVLLALGLTNRLDGNIVRVLVLMAIAMTLSLVVILLFKGPLQRVFKKHPSINILGLGFLILVGFAMLVEGAYLSHFHLFGSDAGLLPKNYLYLAISLSLLIMYLVVKFRKENVKGELVD